MDGVTEVLKLLSTYGAPFLITAIVLIAIWRGMGILFDWLQDKAKGRASPSSTLTDHEKLEVIRYHVNAVVTQKLTSLLHRTHAVRAYVFEYHNGNQSFGGLPFLYMTNTYEEVAPGIRSEQPRRQHQSQQMLSTFITAIEKNSRVIIDRENETPEFSKYIYGILSEEGTLLKVTAKLVNPRGKIIGHVGLDYATRPTQETLEEASKAIKYSAAELGTLLSVDDKEELRI